MSGAASDSGPRGTLYLVTLCTLVFLGAMAFAVPSAPIETSVTGARRGYLVGHSRFSESMAAQIARNGYSFLAVDLTNARLEGEALWAEHFRSVGARRFPTWGWVDLQRGTGDLEKRIRALNLAGVFLYGPGAQQAAELLRAAHGGLTVFPVVRFRDLGPADAGECAVAMEFEEFLENAADEAFPVLIADQLDLEQIEDARAAAAGDYLIARVAVLD
ncbi:MAG: hypothetical protein ACYSX0_01435 [Planctomycetota bacterium]|jgi:hypothetical protein